MSRTSLHAGAALVLLATFTTPLAGTAGTTPDPEALPDHVWADEVVGFTPGDGFKDGALAAQVADGVLGPPDPGFLSLGNGGGVQVAFTDNVLVGDGSPAADLFVYEIGPSAEATRLTIYTADGTTAVPLYDTRGTGACGTDPDDTGEDAATLEGDVVGVDIDCWVVEVNGMSAGTRFTAVRIDDVASKQVDNNSDTPGADIDAVGTTAEASEPSPEESGPPVYGPDDLPDLMGEWRTTTGQWGDQVLVRVVNDERGTILRGTVWTPTGGSQCPPRDATVWEMTDVTTESASGWVDQYGRNAAGDCVVVSRNRAAWQRNADSAVFTYEHYEPETSAVEVRTETLFRERSTVISPAQPSAPDGLGPHIIHLFIGAALGLDLDPGSAFAQASDGPVVMLATAEAFPDALAAAGFGGDVGAFTQLLSPTDRDRNLALLGAITPAPSRYVVIGGSAALPDEVLPDPADPSTPPMSRVAGQNRFDTAAQLAQAGWPDGADLVFVATGRNYPDALAGGSVAAAGHHPILLVDGERIPEETVAALEQLRPRRIVLLGGPAAVPATVDAQLAPYAPEGLSRVQGATRVDTAIALSRATFTDGTVSHVTLVPGDRPQEALLAAPLGFYTGGPMFLLQSEVPPALPQELRRLGVSQAVAVSAAGGIPDALLHEVEDAITAAASGAGP